MSQNGRKMAKMLHSAAKKFDWDECNSKHIWNKQLVVIYFWKKSPTPGSTPLYSVLRLSTPDSTPPWVAHSDPKLPKSHIQTLHFLNPGISTRQPSKQWVIDLIPITLKTFTIVTMPSQYDSPSLDQFWHKTDLST